MDDKTKRRALKILALAERGCDGEQETALRMLNRILEKHGMTIDDLATLDIEWVRFEYSGDLERRLLINIVGSVIGSHTFGSMQSEKLQVVEIELNKPDAVEIEILFDVYKKALKTETDRLMTAFFVKHDIGYADRSTPIRPMTWAEQVRIGQIMDMMAHVDKPNKRIN